MSGFEFAFSLLGLVLGLCVTEIVSGFARVLRRRGRIRLGWLTPMLGLLLFVDLITFWGAAWSARDTLVPGFLPLLFGTSIAAIYYLSASLVFPEDVGEWPDLDEYFLRHKGQVMAGVIVANLAVNAVRDWVIGPAPADWRAFAIPILYVSLASVLILAKDRRTSGVALVAILQLYWIFEIL